MAVRRGTGQAQGAGGLFERKAGKVTKFDQFGLVRVHLGQAGECLIKGKEAVILARGGGGIDLVQVDALMITASPQAALLPCAIDQDAPHGLGRGGIEVASAGPRNLAGTHQLQVGLVDKGRRRQRVRGPFAGQISLGRLAQLVVDKRKQPVGSGSIPGRCGVHQDRGIFLFHGDAGHCTGRRSAIGPTSPC
jgi:hypothetical protein